MLTDEECAALAHRIMCGLAGIASGMRGIADEIECGDIPPHKVSGVIRELADKMTEQVRDISA